MFVEVYRPHWEQFKFAPTSRYINIINTSRSTVFAKLLTDDNLKASTYFRIPPGRFKICLCASIPNLCLYITRHTTVTQHYILDYSETFWLSPIFLHKTYKFRQATFSSAETVKFTLQYIRRFKGRRKTYKRVTCHCL